MNLNNACFVMYINTLTHESGDTPFCTSSSLCILFPCLGILLRSLDPEDKGTAFF